MLVRPTKSKTYQRAQSNNSTYNVLNSSASLPTCTFTAQKNTTTPSTNQKFIARMEKRQIEYENNTLNIQTTYIAQAINLSQKASKYSKKTRAYWRYKKDALNMYYKGAGISNAYKRKMLQRNVFLGMTIWSLAGLKNINVSGFRALAVSVIKIVLSTFISPTAGAKYVDVPIAVLQGACTKFTPNLSTTCKNIPTFAELVSAYKNISHEIQALNNLDNLTDEAEQKENLYADYKKLQTQFKLRVEHLKYTLKGNYRSLARIAVLGIILILLITTSGLSFGANIGIIAGGHLLYCLACGIDTYFQNKHQDWTNLRYSDFLKEDIDPQRLKDIQNKKIMAVAEDICIAKTRLHWMTDIDFQIQSIHAIYTHKMSKLSKKLQKLEAWQPKNNNNNNNNNNNHHENTNNNVPFNNAIKQHIKKINQQKHQKKQVCINKMQELTEQMYLYEQRKFTELNPCGIIAKCLAHSMYFKKQIIIAAMNQTNMWEQQAAKNLGSSNYSIPFSLVGEPAYYALHNTELFTAAKIMGGMAPPMARSAASAQREEIKRILNLNIDEDDIVKRTVQTLNNNQTFKLTEIDYIKTNSVNKNNKNTLVIGKLTLEHKDKPDIAYNINVMDYAPQSHQILSKRMRYLNILKGSWISTKGLIAIPKNYWQLRNV